MRLYEVVHSLQNGNAILWARFGFGEGEGLCPYEGSSSDEDSPGRYPLCLCRPMGLGKSHPKWSTQYRLPQRNG